MLRLPDGVSVVRVGYDADRDNITVVLQGDAFPAVAAGDVIPYVLPLCHIEEPFGVRVEWPYYTDGVPA